MSPKWQRARMVGPEFLTAHVEVRAHGPLFWVRVKPPSHGYRERDDGTRVAAMYHDTNWRYSSGHLLALGVDRTELLPEFSFADDPDADVSH